MHKISGIQSLILRIGVCCFVLLANGSNLTPGMATAGFSLRFYGNGYGDIDRVKIRIDVPAVPADIGVADFTIEFWMKASLASNTGSVSCNNNDGWITGNIMIDRDSFGEGDYGDFGISLNQGKIAIGVSQGSSGTTLCGASNVADNSWHHIAITRNQANGQIRIFVDGQQDGQSTGPTGNVSYRDNRSTSYNDDPFLVIGAEKHDAGSQYPSYNGWIDELRLSKNIRYTTNFSAPTQPFSTDPNTAALYHFDEGPAGNCLGSILDVSGASGGPSNGVCNFGGSPGGPVYTTDIPFVPDITPPTISQITSWPMDTIANITWSTNEPADSQVFYDADNSPNTPSALDASYVTGHAVSLSGLQPNTIYFFYVISKDPSGNTQQSNMFSFQTLNPTDVSRLYLPFMRR